MSDYRAVCADPSAAAAAGGVRRRVGLFIGLMFALAISASLIASQARAAGVVTNYTDPSISSPIGIAAGPDGALWFTNAGNGSIGRITTTGAVSNFAGAGISDPQG